MPAPESTKKPPQMGPARRKRALPLEVVSAGMLARRVDVRPADVVFVKGILEASEGLGAVFAERGGELVLSAPLDRAKDFEELLADLVADVGAKLDPESPR